MTERVFRDRAEAGRTLVEEFGRNLRTDNSVVFGLARGGVPVAAYLTDAGATVTLVAPQEVPFATLFGEEVGRKFAQMHRDAGVTLKLGNGVFRLIGSGSVESVELSDGSKVPADLVVVGIGVEPVVDYLEGSGLVADGAVPVDSHLRTRADGVYAAGDFLAGYFVEGRLAAVGTMGRSGEAIRYGQLLDEGRSITTEQFDSDTI